MHWMLGLAAAVVAAGAAEPAPAKAEPSVGDPPQTELYLGRQRDPIPGMILPSWTPST